MREIDRATLRSVSESPPITLMENAGSAVARFVLSDYPHVEACRDSLPAKANKRRRWILSWPASSSKRGVRCAFFCCVIPKSFAGMQR